eukprot:TRINITY_DN6820_c0_g1_i5.p1 TRINITY_DN6820_c0_g1~~TRINITY_DN6820_c0_g1_i5.p1  ORF type:complete len:1020 (+),score=28.13 TRINITY_DN6820_c0_g1_i5:698-3757(+)
MDPVFEQQLCNTDPCPIDCVVSAWSPWANCSVPCGGGSQQRSRNVTIAAAYGGASCPELIQVQSCNAQKCPDTKCTVTAWSSYDSCTKSCGGGTHTRTRSILVRPTGNETCPVLSETTSCNTNSCPVDCVVSDWGTYSSCSLPCGGGQKTRTRTILVQSAFGGTACPTVLSDDLPCNEQPCPIDCVVSGWGPWGSCSKTCGGGVQSRERVITVQPANGGLPCPELSEVTACSLQPCPVDCIVGDWGIWGVCSKSCGNGTKTRSRHIDVQPENGGLACPELSQVSSCNEQPCPIDCVLSAWGPWETCSAECGGGQTVRHRTVDVPAANGGAPCGSLSETAACNELKCPDVKCIVSDWSEWTPCSVTCGGGTQSHNRIIVLRPTGLERCPALEETRTCNELPCPVDCIVTDWSAWGLCSRDCGTGEQTRTRTISRQDAYGGIPCPSVLSESQKCNEQPCPVDCVLSEWSLWSGCTVACAGGTSTRSRAVITAPANGGLACGPLEEIKTCNPQPCPVDCVVSDWGEWSACSKSCGGGERKRHRTVVTSPQYNGKSCPMLDEYDICNTDHCPVDCVVGLWSEWTTCSHACGGGKRTRTRAVQIDAAYGGLACPPLSESEACNPTPCPVDCQVSEWGPWNQCSAPCAGGTRSRERVINVQPAFGGNPCPALLEYEGCNEQACPDVKCQVSDWSDWSPCSVPCGGGINKRTRTVVVAPTGTEQCSALSELRSCNEQPCPIDCVMSAWSDFDTCTKLCGSGSQSRTRTVLVRAAYGGQECPTVLTESRVCNELPCPVDCSVSEWSGWTDCSVQCGGGTQTRSRSIVIPAANGGASCPEPRSQSQHCNAHACPVDCVVAQWDNWGPCSQSCGGGERKRLRAVITQAANGGAACPALEEYERCNEQPCAIDCVVGQWGQWGVCSKDCGTGQRTRMRAIVTPAQNGGAACPDLVETEDCNTQSCPINCVVSPWSSWHDCSVSCGGGQQNRTRTITTAAAWGGDACPFLVEHMPRHGNPCPVRPCPGGLE